MLNSIQVCFQILLCFLSTVWLCKLFLSFSSLGQFRSFFWLPVIAPQISSLRPEHFDDRRVPSISLSSAAQKLKAMSINTATRSFSLSSHSLHPAPYTISTLRGPIHLESNTDWSALWVLLIITQSPIWYRLLGSLRFDVHIFIGAGFTVKRSKLPWFSDAH